MRVPRFRASFGTRCNTTKEALPSLQQARMLHCGLVGGTRGSRCAIPPGGRSGVAPLALAAATASDRSAEVKTDADDAVAKRRLGCAGALARR